MQAVRFLPLQRLTLPALIVLLIVVTLFGMVQTWMKTADDSGAYDLQPYWYWGHYVWAGMNPYLAYGERLPFPGGLTYVDGSMAQPNANTVPQLGRVPANTAPMLLLLSLLSLFAWTPAKFFWLLFNIVLIAVIPWLALRLVHKPLQLAQPVQWLVALAFYAMKGTRVALATGQPSVLVFALMLVTLLTYRSQWMVAGLALGIALSKYSIALPVVLFLLWRRCFRVLLVAAGVQIAGLLWMVALGGNVTGTVQLYWSMIPRHAAALEGVHLAAWLPNQPIVVNTLIVAGSIVTVGTVLLARRRGWIATDLLVVNGVLALWTLLVAYHRVYDTMLVLFFLVAALVAATRWQLPRGQAYALGLFWLAVVGVLCVPGSIVPPWLSASQADLFVLGVERSVTVALLAMWAVNLWLVMRSSRMAREAGAE
jgi:hypothetical protein